MLDKQKIFNVINNNIDKEATRELYNMGKGGLLAVQSLGFSSELKELISNNTIDPDELKYTDEKSSLLFSTENEENKLHASWLLSNGMIISVEFIPENYPSTFLVV